jgi:hypothetical protein
MLEAAPSLTSYLRSFALWAKNNIDTKLDTQSAQPGILLHANDAPLGTTPAVFSIEVRTDGTIVAIPIAISPTRRMA